MLGWAHSLMDFTYQLIDTHLEHAGPPKWTTTVPRLKFVEGAIAVVQKHLDAGPNAVPLSNRAVYLLEELIPRHQEFIKYIHNGDAVPLLAPHEEGYSTALFLCFVQHVQYHATHRQVFISDFQGAGLLLTDPQIMTDPSIGPSNLFGDGNVEKAFMAFPKQHICNMWCEWMGYGALQPDSDINHNHNGFDNAANSRTTNDRSTPNLPPPSRSHTTRSKTGRTTSNTANVIDVDE